MLGATLLLPFGPVLCQINESPTNPSGGNSSLGDFPRLDNIASYFGIVLDEQAPGNLARDTFWTSALYLSSKLAETAIENLQSGARISFGYVEFRIELLPNTRPHITLSEALWTLQLIAQRRFYNENGLAFSGHLIDKSDPDNVVEFAEFYFKRLNAEVADTSLDGPKLPSSGNFPSNQTLVKRERSWTWRNIPEVVIDNILGSYTVVSLYAVEHTAPQPYNARWNYLNRETGCQWSYVPRNPARSTLIWRRGDMVGAVDHFQTYWNDERPRRMPRIKSTIADLRDDAENFQATIIFLRN